jgi:hypothetical protein
MRFDGFRDYEKVREMLAIGDRRKQEVEECAVFVTSMRDLMSGLGRASDVYSLGMIAAGAMKGEKALEGAELRTKVAEIFGGVTP